MQVQRKFNVNAVNQTNLSIYSLLVSENTEILYIGCGLWDRENMPHTNFVKNKTPGGVFQINSRNGRIIHSTKNLENIVYPLVPSPWKGFFIGCRTGAAYHMNYDMKVQQIGSYGEGIYGVTYSPSLEQFIIGGRNGKLYCLNKQWYTLHEFLVANNRLWNLCLDYDDTYVWVSSYNKRLYKVHVPTGRIVFEENLGSGAITFSSLLSDGTLAIGSMGKKINLLKSEKVIRTIQVKSPVCFLIDIPELKYFLATGYKGQVWVFDYDGEKVDELLMEVRENNPIWIGQAIQDGRCVLAWANGDIRMIQI